LTEFDFYNTHRAFAAEQDNDNRKLAANSSVEAVGIPSLFDLYKIWERQVGSPRVKKTHKPNRDERSQSSTDEASDADTNMEDIASLQAKRKQSSGGTSSAGSSSSSDSDADDEDEEEAMIQPAKSVATKRKANFSSSSSSSSSSSESGSGSKSKSANRMPKAKKTKLSNDDETSDSSAPSSKSEDSASTSTSDSSSESESDSDASSTSSSSESEREAVEKLDKTLRSAAKTPLPPSDGSDSSDTSSELSNSDGGMAVHTPMPRKSSTDTGTLVASSGSPSDGSSSDAPSSTKSKTPVSKKQPTKTHAKDPPVKSIGQPAQAMPSNGNQTPTARNPKHKHTGARPTPLATAGAYSHDHPSNIYIPYEFAQRAHNDLSITRGKGFTKEKNKKKRGSYRGGAIDIGPAKHSHKFED
jgi:SRP40, C-terminal domain